MQLAAEGARGAGVELVALDSFDHQDRDAAALRCAERAAGDAKAIAYLGDFHSSQVHVTQPVLGAAGLLQVAPVATWVGLGGATLVRLSPHDGIGAEAIAAWLSAVGVGSLLVVHDHDEGYGRPAGALCAEAARAAGVQV